MNSVQRRRTMLVPAGLWAALLAWTLVGSGNYPECTASSPCGSDWPGAGLIVLWLSTIVLLVWTPALARITVAALAPLSLLLSNREYPYVSTALLVAGVLICTAVSYAALALLAAGDRRSLHVPPVVSPARQGPWPGPLPRAFWRPGTVSGAALLTAGLVLLVLAVNWGRHHARLEAQAPRVQARVLAHESDRNSATDRVLVEISADRRERIETESLSSYPVGSTTTVLLLPEGRVRLAAEPYDGSTWGAGAFALLALGGTLLYRGRAANNRLMRTLSSPTLPVTDVAAFPCDMQMLLYRSGHQASDAQPIGTLNVSRYQAPAEPDPYASDPEGDMDDLADDVAQLPAQVYGLLVDGETVGAVLQTPDGPAYIAGRFTLHSGSGSAVPSIAEDADDPTEDVDVSLSDLPITWRPTRLHRLIAVTGMVGAVVIFIYAQKLSMNDSWLDIVWNLAIAFSGSVLRGGWLGPG